MLCNKGELPEMTSGYRFYRFAYILARTVYSFIYRIKVIGKANIPDGPCIICANHSALIDPILLIFAFGRQNHLHIMAKIELFKIPVLSSILKKLEMICVDRSTTDVSAIKDSLRHLKNGEKIAVFPEGTRVSEDDTIAAKSGAVRLALKSGTPIIPVYIPRKKKVFGLNKISIGEQYFIEKTSSKMASDEYNVLADEIMNRIKALYREQLSAE